MKKSKRIVTFKKGNLKDISIYITNEYEKVAYPEGDTDPQMMSDIQKSKPLGKVIFDVGAFIGASSLVFAKLVGKNGKIVSFEPNPFNEKRIYENLVLNNDFKKRINVFPVALSDEEGEMNMTLSSSIDNGYSSTSRLNESHPTLHNDQLPQGFEEVPVDVTTLDKFVMKYKIIPDILKVDIEGAEYNFLLGSRSVISKYKPVFYIEIHSEFCAVRCLEFLHSMKYDITILHEEEDNRIMIKAVFNKQRETIPNNLAISAQKNLDASLSMIKIAKEALDDEIRKNRSLESDLGVLKQELCKRNFEDELLLKENTILQKDLLSYENSNSWKITKPLRYFRNFFRK